MNIQDAVRKLTVEVKEVGVADTTKKVTELTLAEGNLEAAQKARNVGLDKIMQAQMRMNAAMEKQAMQMQQMIAFDRVTAAALADQTRQQQMLTQQVQVATAANDNYTRGMKDQSIGWIDLAAKVYLAKAAYDFLIGSLGVVGTVVNAVFKGIAAVATYLPNKIGEIWQEGTDKLGTYVAISEKAGTLGTDFYQRIVQGATGAKTTTDALLAVVNNLNAALETKLGGSTFANQVSALQSSGNLQGQRGAVADVNSASTPEAQFAASAKLIQSAMDAGERLVALDLTKSLWGEEARKKLADNSDYIHQITTAVNSVKDAQIIAQPQIDRAVGLKIALEDANKTLADIYAKNKGAASDWSATGIRIQEVWVGVVVGYAASLSWLDRNIDALQKWLGLYTEVSKQTPQNTLASQMQNPQNIKNAMAQAQRIDDTFDFKPPDHKATDQATASVLQYIDATKLAASIVGLSAREAQRLTIEHQLDAAAIKDGLDPAVERLTAKYSLLRQEATDAAAALDEVNKKQAGINALAEKFKSGEAGYKSAQDSNQAYIDATNLAIKYHDQAGALKEAQVNATLLAAALKAGRSGESPEDFAKAKQAGALAAQLAGLNETKDAYDRAMEGVEKYILTTNAAAASVDAGVAAQEKAKVIAQLTAGAMRDGKTNLEQYAAAWDEAGNRAGEAAKKLALAQVQSQIKFDKATVGMSPEDVQIAQQLWKIYDGDIPKALASTEAADMRLNNQLKFGREIVSGFGNDLVSGLLRGENGMKSLESAATNLIAKLSSKNLTNFLNGGSIFGNQSLNSAQGAVGMASAGLAGYQSGNPLAGALGGAMAGATFGPAGMAVGGAIGLISSIIGADDKSRQQLQQAQAAWKTMAPSVSAFKLAKTEAKKENADNDNSKEIDRERDQHHNAA